MKKFNAFLVIMFFAANCFGADLIVLSGAGLMKPMEELRQGFERRYGVNLDIHYGSSGEIFGQVASGQACDVLVPGAKKYTEDALKNGWVIKGTIKTLVYHVPTIAVPSGNPKNITCLEDLAKPGVRIAIGDPRAPAIGRVARKILIKNGLWERVMPNITVYAPTVNQLLIYVALSQVDAAIIWADLATWAEAKGKLKVVKIAKKKNMIRTISTAVCTNAPHRDMARKFNEYISSNYGMKVWQKWGFKPCRDN